MKFEEALERLNKIKDQLENPEITLDESIKLYQESVEYTKTCLDVLKETDGKVVAIKAELDAIIEKPLDEIEE